MPVFWLERTRNYSLAGTFLLVPILVVVVIFGALNDARPPWEALYIGVAALTLGASTTFTITAIAIAMRRTRHEAATGARNRLRGSTAIRLLGVIALAANLVVVGLSGRVNALNVVLALLVAALLFLLREHARREGIRDRTR